MKIQCSVCEAAEATVLCCADDAAMCADCDQKVHAANRLSGKHQRVPLSASSSKMPKCDVCQETAGYFFCLEDRALLCRRCDIATHTANRLVSAHQRFLLTGVKVGLEAAKLDPPVSSGTKRSQSIDKTSGSNPPLAPRSTTMQVAATDQSNKTLPVQTTVGGDISLSKLPILGSSKTKSFSQWELDEFLELGDSGLEFMDPALSKSDRSSLLRVTDLEVEGDECLGQSPNAFWTVPEVPSSPTASGLAWPKIPQTPSDSAAFVPDSAAIVPGIISLPARSPGGENLF
ncbi:B-box zinc finger protein 22-like [Salvia hispanica]|uniref:B-box zinc finger protein 22-like n=1 Tax=Salvia hispanica TaxID=49212 RepID=UPI00200942CB|nr:B-box zinc finger protein 22-like [Salvia hispanica]